MSKPTLEDAVRDTQQTNLADRGADTSRTPDVAADHLLSECRQNAATLRDTIHDRGIDFRVVGGAPTNTHA